MNSDTEGRMIQTNEGMPDAGLAAVAARMRNAAAKAPYRSDSDALDKLANEYWRGYRKAALEAADALDALAELSTGRGR